MRELETRVQYEARREALRAETPEEKAKAAKARASQTAQARLSAIERSRSTRDIDSVRSFEYLVVELDEGRHETQLNEIGSLGWELVNVTAPASGEQRFYFKREVWTQVDAAGNASAVAPSFTGAGNPATLGKGGSSPPTLSRALTLMAMEMSTAASSTTSRAFSASQSVR